MSPESDCLFCKIVARKIPGRIVEEDGEAIVIEDIAPQAPVHLLLIPKRHQVNLFDADDEGWLGRLLSRLPKLARQQNLSDFRVVINSGAAAGQSVFHLHLHLLGGRPMRWPPG
jgi:diadenosine tetraphosphate (Ap4A) HIT family hydrolase